MIVALGTDLVSVERIGKAMQHPRFVSRILTAEEMANRDVTPEFVAGRWAAKEAISKCCPWIFSWHQMTIVGPPKQAPEIWVEGLPPGERVVVSISHERTMAFAVAIRESE